MSCAAYPELRQLELAKLQKCPRSRRVILLLATLVVLGLADLHLTIHHHTTIGMEELNPIGAYFLNHDEIAALVMFKLGTIAIATGALLLTRQHTLGEISTWFAFVVMVALTLHWHQYNSELIDGIDGEYVQVSQQLQVSMAAHTR